MSKSALIVEDHPIYRDALMMFLSAILGSDNVKAVSSTEEGLAQASMMEQVGLILLDLGLPGTNGVEAVVSLQRKYQNASIVVISSSEERLEMSAVLRAGVKAFISKAVPTKVMSEVVQKILAGEPLESTWVTVKTNQTASEKSLTTLTPRQHETLIFLCKGLSNKEIGLRLGLAEITVKMHVSSIFRALNVVNRTQAVLTARRLGLYSQDDNA